MTYGVKCVKAKILLSQAIKSGQRVRFFDGAQETYPAIRR
jgi:hypothetical protein